LSNKISPFTLQVPHTTLTIEGVGKADLLLFQQGISIPCGPFRVLRDPRRFGAPAGVQGRVRPARMLRDPYASRRPAPPHLKPET